MLWEWGCQQGSSGLFPANAASISSGIPETTLAVHVECAGFTACALTSMADQQILGWPQLPESRTWLLVS